jgi:cell division protease FtsH
MEQAPKKRGLNEGESRPRFNFKMFYGLMFIWAMILAHDYVQYRRDVQAIPYSQFLRLVDQGKVAEVSIGTQKIEGTLKGSTKDKPNLFATVPVNDPQLPSRLDKAGVKFGGLPENTFMRGLLSWIIPFLLLFAFWSFLSNRLGQARTSFLSFGKSKARVYAEKDIQTRFSDVAGVLEGKAELEEVVQFLKNPAFYSRLGGRMPKGILLVGPPGTGKTLLARAVAGEASVPFFSINGSEFVELFVGLGAARVRDLFEQARAHAPCIIFIDELDALGRARGLNAVNGSSNDEKEQTLNQLLAELDGFDSSTGIILLGATNRPEVLDPALLRAGRFDRQILIDKPDRKDREAILRVHLKKLKSLRGIDPETLASLTAGFSGADLANLVNEAALMATRRGADAVESRDFTEAIERIVAGLERRNRILSDDEKKRVAYHEMGHATVALAMGKGEAVHKVTIVPRGMGALGYTFRRPLEDRYLMESRELLTQMAMLLGGRAAEIMFFDDISTGAADDLDKVTEIARAIATRYGMSSKLGAMTYERDLAPFLPGQPPMRTHSYSEKTAQLIDEEVHRLIDDAMEAARDCLSSNKSFIEQAAEALLKSETLDEEQLKLLWRQYHTEKAPVSGGPMPVLTPSFST